MNTIVARSFPFVITFLLLNYLNICNAEVYENCPMSELIELIEKTEELGSSNWQRSMIIKKVAEKKYGCGWTVLVVDDKDMVGRSVSYKIAMDISNDEQQSFCTHILPNGKFYNVFKGTDCLMNRA